MRGCMLALKGGDSRTGLNVMDEPLRIGLSKPHASRLQRPEPAYSDLGRCRKGAGNARSEHDFGAQRPRMGAARLGEIKRGIQRARRWLGTKWQDSIPCVTCAFLKVHGVVGLLVSLGGVTGHVGLGGLDRILKLAGTALVPVFRRFGPEMQYTDIWIIDAVGEPDPVRLFPQRLDPVTIDRKSVG